MDTIIPEISLVSLQNQSESDLRTLKEALNTHGFFTIIDHDIDDLLLDESYTYAKEFFDLPEEMFPLLVSDFTIYLNEILLSN